MMNQESLIREIKSLSDSIRTKNRALKLGISERDSFIETTFRPVVGSLKEISNKLQTNIPSLNESNIHNFNDVEAQYDSDGSGEDGNISNDEADKQEEEVTNDEDEGTSSSSSSKNYLPTTSSNLSIIAKDITSKGVLTRKYLMKMLHDIPKGRQYHVYGARMDNDGIMIGDAPLEIDEEDNLNIKGKIYPGSQGLFELIFKSTPIKYAPRDLKMFKDILKLTNAHRKNYSSNLPVYRNSSKKYRNVIVKLFPPRSAKTTGQGLTMKKLYETNIIYYNNVNKLVDRLRLLWESKQAGHSGLDNEIVALSDELRKRGYIK